MPLFSRSGSRPGDEPEDVAGYRNLRRIGHGGFSVVYRAHQDALDREVALKVVTVGLDDDVQRRFLREVMLTGRLTGHPNAVSTLDAGLTRSGRPYLAMDLYEGGSMLDRLNAQGPLPAAEVARVGARVAGALDAAHRLGIVHRDVKPSNILISRFGEPVLADFGVACLLDDRASATVLGTFTLRHAAPEVVNGGKPGAASDVYALGSTLYELLTGRPAFDGRGMEMLALMRRILTEEPAPLTCPELPALAGVVARAMAKRPQDRHPDAAALAAALGGLVPGFVPVAPAAPGALAAPAPGSPVSPAGPAVPAAQWDPAQWDPAAQWDRAAQWDPGARQGPAEPAEPGRLPRTEPLPPEEVPSAPVPGGPGDFAHTALRPGRTRPPAAPEPEQPRRRRRVLLTALGVVLVLGGATGVMFLRHGSDGGVAAGAVTGTRASQPTTSSARPTATGTSARTSPRPGRPATGPTPGTGPAPLPGTNPPRATTAVTATAAQPPPAPPSPTSGGPVETIAPVPPSRCTPSGCAGRAYFVATGEHLFVCDENSDGYGAIARYTRTDVPGQNNVAADKNGAGTCVDHNMNMPEGAHITFSICLINKAGTIFRCSSSITATA